MNPYTSLIQTDQFRNGLEGSSATGGLTKQTVTHFAGEAGDERVDFKALKELLGVKKIKMLGTEEMVKKAVELVMPAANEILASEGTTWGPKWVEIWIQAPGVEQPLAFAYGLGDLNKWNPEWGARLDFGEIAAAKLQVITREHADSGHVVIRTPWQFEEGEYLYAGGIVREGIYVAVSGAKEAVDTAIAEMVASAIAMLAYLETAKRLKEGKERI